MMRLYGGRLWNFLKGGRWITRTGRCFWWLDFTDPIFRDDRQIIRRVEGDTKHTVTDEGVLELYYDRVELHWPGTDLVWAMGDIQKLDYVSRQSLLLITEDSYFDIGSAVPRSPTKYIEAWRFLTGRESY